MLLKYKICSLQSPLTKELISYKQQLTIIQRNLHNSELAFKQRGSDTYLEYDKELLNLYKHILNDTKSRFPSDEIINNQDNTTLKKLFRVNSLLSTLNTLSSYLNETETEKNVLDTMQLAPEERTWLQALLSVFRESNKRHEYYKTRNKHLTLFAERLHSNLQKSILNTIKDDQLYEIYQTEKCSLKNNSQRLFWMKISLGYRKFLEILRLAKTRDNIDYEFDNPEGKIFASIRTRAGTLTPEDLINIHYPDENIVTAEQLIETLKENNILSSTGEIIINPFDEEDITTKLTPVLSNFGFNIKEITNVLQGCFKINITIEQQENLTMGFSPIGRQMIQEHPHHTFNFYNNRFAHLKTIKSNKILTPKTITEPLIRDVMSTINETDADKLLVTFGKIAERSFMNVVKEHYVSRTSRRPNRRKYSLELERKELINAELSSRIFSKLTETKFLNDDGLVNKPHEIFKFRSNTKKRLKNVLNTIHAIDSENTLSRKQKRQVLRILKKAAETKFSENATIQTTKLVTNEHGLNDFTIFLIEDNSKKWILFPYDHYGNPSYNLIKVPNKLDFQKALKQVPSKIGLPKGLYYSFYNKQFQIINKSTNVHDLSMLYRKLSSNQYFLRTLAGLTFLGFVLPNDPIFNVLAQGENLGIGFSIYLWFKISRGIAAASILKKHLKNCERKLSTLRYSLSVTTAFLYLLMYAVPQNSMMKIGDTYWSLFVPLIIADIFFSGIRWPINNEKIQRSLPTYPKHILAGYLLIISTILGSIWMPNFMLTNDLTKTLIIVMESMRVGTYLRRDIPKANRSLEERYSHKFETPTAITTVATHVGATALLLYFVDKLLDYIHSSYYLLP